MDEVTEPVDPVEALVRDHMARMQEFSDESFEKVKQVCSDSVDRLKRNVGLRDAVVDRTLAALGIASPAPEDNE